MQSKDNAKFPETMANETYQGFAEAVEGSCGNVWSQGQWLEKVNQPNTLCSWETTW
jgi:hypothetical protein